MKSLESELREKDQKIRALQESLRKLAKGTQHDSKAITEVVESYRAIGLTEQEARIAAGVESAVEHVTESRRKLREVAKSLGMSESEADAFATPAPRRYFLGF